MSKCLVNRATRDIIRENKVQSSEKSDDFRALIIWLHSKKDTPMIRLVFKNHARLYWSRKQRRNEEQRTFTSVASPIYT